MFLAIPLNIDSITRSAHRPADWPPGGFGCVGFGFGVGMAGVQTLIRRSAPRSSCWGGRLPALAQIGARSIRCSVMPGCFDEQPADMTVTGLGDPALG